MPGDELADLWIDHLNLRGANDLAGTGNGAFDVSMEGQHCLKFFGVHGLCVTNCELSYSYGDLLYFDSRKIWPSGDPRGTDWTRDVWVYGNTLHHSGRQGVTFQGVRDVVFCRNTIGEIARSTFEFEPRASAFNFASGIHIADNDIGTGRLNLLANHGSGPVGDIWVTRNRLSRPLKITVHDDLGGRRTGYHILDNVVDAATPVTTGVKTTVDGERTVMDFENVDGLEVRGNVQHVKKGRNVALVTTIGCTGVDVSGDSVADGVELRPG